MARTSVRRIGRRSRSEAPKGLRERIADRVSRTLVGDSVEGRVRRRLVESIETDPVRAAEALFPMGGGGGVGPSFGLQANLGNELQTDLDDLRQFGSPSLKIYPLDFLQRLYWVLWHVEPMVGNVVQTWTSLIIGNGVNVSVPEGQTRTDGADARNSWEDFGSATGYLREGGLVNQGVLDTMLIGERFHWYDPVPDEDEQEAILQGALQLTYPTDMRVLDPISNGGISDVRYDPRDPTQPLAYIRTAGASIEELPPWAINHWKVPFGAIQSRGRPFMERATQDLFRLRQTVVTEWVLQVFRLQSLGMWYNRETTDADALGADVDLPPPLTIMEIPPGASLEMPDLRKTVIGGRLDNTPDRMLVQRIAQAVQLPFHLVAQEFREANLASLSAAEGPLAKQAESLIKRFEFLIEQDVRMVVGDRQQNGDPMIVEVDIPPVIIRDPADDRESWLSMYEAGAISLQTLHEKTGINPEDEATRLEGREDEEVEQASEAHPNGGWVPLEDDEGKPIPVIH